MYKKTYLIILLFILIVGGIILKSAVIDTRSKDYEDEDKTYSVVDDTKNKDYEVENKTYPMAEECSVEMSILPDPNYPAELCIDGNINTYPCWKDSSSIKEAEGDENLNFNLSVGAVTYTFKFNEPKLINRIRFIQAEKFCAISYKILAKKVGGKEFDIILAEVNDKTAPGDVWIEHEFEPVEVSEILFVPLAGFGYGPRPYPAIAEFEAYNSDSQRTVVDNSPINAVVDFNTGLSINGYKEVHDGMFSICGITSLHPGTLVKYVKSLSLGADTHWPFWGYANNILKENPNNPGHFNEDDIESGILEKQVKDHSILNRIELDKIMGASINIGLITAPPYMRDIDYEPTIDSRFEGQGDAWQMFAPPKDPVEWGKWVGHILKKHNELSGNVIERAYIWNEPNTTKYWPVPWNDKASRYVDMHKKAVPEIKRLNPDVKIAGPVITGGTVLGWNNVYDTDQYNFWVDWYKNLIDECGEYIDGIDLHNYRMDSEVFMAEAPIFKNYFQIKNMPNKLIASSEGAIAAGADLEMDEIALYWRYNTVFWADFIFKALDMPDKIDMQSYFHYKDDVLGVFDDADEPRAIYYFYWLMRNFRGERIYTEVQNNDKDINMMACKNGNKYNIVIQNFKGINRKLDINLKNIDLQLIDKIELDKVEYNPKSQKVENMSEAFELADENMSIDMKPYGLYSIVITQKSDKELLNTYVLNEYMDDKVFSKLDETNEIEFNININEDLNKTKEAVLKFGTSGIEYSRMAVYIDKRLPIVLNINGNEHEILAGKYNEIEIDTKELKENNKITMKYNSEEINDYRIVKPEDFYILFISVTTENLKGK